MAIVGRAQVLIEPSFDKFQRTVGKGIGQPLAQEGPKQGKNLGDRIIGGLGTALKVGAATTVAAGAGLIGTALVQGFGRLRALEEARAKLEGLGHSAQGVETIMEDALAAVKGTAFGMGEAATTAASAVAAGVKPGKDLQRTLTLVGDAAQIAQTDMATMGSIVNKVATSDMMQMDVANQLMDAGIPILQMVADQMGITAGEARKMASEGKISFEIFQNALEEGVGGAAQKSGETLAGAFANTKASLGRIGASLLEPFYGLVKDFLNYAMDTLGPVEDWAKSIQPILESGIQDFVVWIQSSFLPAARSMIETLRAVAQWVSENSTLVIALTKVVLTVTAALVAYELTLKAVNLVSREVAIAKANLAKATAAYNAIVDGGARAIRGWQLQAKGSTKVVERLNWQVKAGAGLQKAYAGAIAASKSVVDGWQLASMGMGHQIGQMNRATKAGAGIFAAYDGAVKGAAAAQRAFNLATANVGGALAAVGGAMRAHPIMAIAGVLATAAAGLTYFFTQTEVGQKLWAQLAEAMKPVTDVIMPVLEDMGNSLKDTFISFGEAAAPVLSNVIQSVSEFAAAILPTLVEVGGTIFEALVPVFQAIGDFILAIGPTLMAFGQTVFEALVPVFQTVAEYLAPMISQIADALAPLLPMFAEAGQQIAEAFMPVIDQVMTELVPAFIELWQALSGILPQLIEALAPILPLIAEGMAQLVAAIAPLVPMLIEALAPIIPMVADALGMLLQALLPVVATLIQSLLPVLPLIVQVFSELIAAIMPLVPLLIEALAPIIPLIVEAFSMLVQAIMPLIPLLISSLVPIVVQLITIVAELVAALLPLAIAFVQAIIPAVLAVLPVLIQLVVFIIQSLVPVIQAILNVVVTVFEALAPIISAALTVVQGVIQTITSLISGDWQGVWDGIKMILSGAWDLMKSIVRGAIKVVWSIISNALDLIMSLWSSIWNGIASVLSWVWNTLIKPVFTALGEYLKWVYSTFIEPVISWILRKWDEMQVGLRAVYDRYIKPMFDKFGEIVQGLKDKFETAVDNIKKAWDQIKRAAAEPIHFVIDSVINNGLIDGFNKLVDWIPGVDGLSHVPIPGWMKDMGFAHGGWTGPGGTYQPAGIVHADEFVIRKLARNRFERENPGLLDHVNQHGTMAGYSGGGLVQPVRGPVTSSFGPRWGGHHSGIDWAVPTGTPVAAAMAGTVLRAAWNAVNGRTGLGILLGHDGDRNTYYGHLSKLLVSVGDTIAKGQTIGLSGNTGNSTGPHLHFETWSGGKPLNPANFLNGAEIPEGDGSGGGWDILAPIRAIKDKVIGWLGDQFPNGGMFVDAGIGIAEWGIDKVIGWAEGLLGGGTDEGKDSAEGTGSVQKQVKDIAAQYGWATGTEWSALSKIISKESSWNPNAANASSTARGLFQLIADNRTSSYRNIGGHTKDGLGYIQNRYGSPSQALAFHNRNNWYADGGLVSAIDNFMVRDRGGVIPPGLNMVLNGTGRDEYALTGAHMDKLVNSLTRESGPAVRIENAYALSTDDLARDITTQQRRARAVQLI